MRVLRWTAKAACLELAVCAPVAALFLVIGKKSIASGFFLAVEIGLLVVVLLCAIGLARRWLGSATGG